MHLQAHDHVRGLTFCCCTLAAMRCSCDTGFCLCGFDLICLSSSLPAELPACCACPGAFLPDCPAVGGAACSLCRCSCCCCCCHRRPCLVASRCSVCGLLAGAGCMLLPLPGCTVAAGCWPDELAAPACLAAGCSGASPSSLLSAPTISSSSLPPVSSSGAGPALHVQVTSHNDGCKDSHRAKACMWACTWPAAYSCQGLSVLVPSSCWGLQAALHCPACRKPLVYGRFSTCPAWRLSCT